jgi:hypothetical protein
MGEFVEAARLDQVPPGMGTMAKVATRDVALFSLGGTIVSVQLLPIDGPAASLPSRRPHATTAA